MLARHRSWPRVKQAPPTVTPVINMVEASWKPSLLWPRRPGPRGTTCSSWWPAPASSATCRSPCATIASTAAFVVINAVTTWQAYNLWGGYDLYQGQNHGGSDYAHRARTVSFDRPYTLGDGAGDFLGLEFPLVSLVESLGLDVTYVTDTDLQRQPNPLLGHKAVISLGHDEYYSIVMRQSLQEATGPGGQPGVPWGQRRLPPHPLRRLRPSAPTASEVDYKSARGGSLYNGKDNADVTVDWRDPPNNDPESQLIGNFYQCNPVRADMVVVGSRQLVVRRDIGATAGQKLSKVVGSEYDHYDPTVPGPANVEILTHSPLRCGDRADFAEATYYSAPSGAGVFASGTIDWVGNIDTHCQPDGCAGRVLGPVMANLSGRLRQRPRGSGPSVQPGAVDRAFSGLRPRRRYLRRSIRAAVQARTVLAPQGPRGRRGTRTTSQTLYRMACCAERSHCG